MKEKVEELRLKLRDCSVMIIELANAGVEITLSVETLKSAKVTICDNTTVISIPTATVQTEL